MTPTLLKTQLFAHVPGIVHGFTTRDGGVSQGAFHALNLGGRVGDERAHVNANRQAVLDALGRPNAAWVALKQVHGDAVFEVTCEAGRSIEADGMWTRDPEALLAVMVADCVPVLMASNDGKVVAAVHAGWRGTRSHIVKRMIERLKESGVLPTSLNVAIGPAIGPCCFEIGEDVAAELRAAYPDAPEAVRHNEASRPIADLWALNRQSALSAGVPAAQIDVLRECCACHPNRFFSHRRDHGTTGRQAAVIGVARAPIS